MAPEPLPDELTVEVYNADYLVLYRIPWQEAIQLILRRAVFIVEVRDPAVHVHSPSVTMEVPESVALREYVHIPHQARDGSRVSRTQILHRDRNMCVYCGGRADTVDHVLQQVAAFIAA